MLPSKKLYIFVCLLTSLLSAVVFAQVGNQASVEGIVTDPSGAMVPNVAIKLTNTGTGAALTGTSNESGYFRFPVIPVGTYELTAESSGFAPYKVTAIDVVVGAKINLPISLGVAGQTAAIVVTGEVPALKATQLLIADAGTDPQVNRPPLTPAATRGEHSRRFLLGQAVDPRGTLLTPAVVKDVRGGDLSFGGQRGTLNSLTIDGTDNNNTFFGQTLGRTGSGRAPYQFSEDAVQEFQVNTNGYSAELGRAGGAITNVVTKSGSNSFHGTAFEFFRDRGLNASDPIYNLNRGFALAAGHAAPVRPGYHYHQFGGNLGGPIKKDKVFFFFDYDGQRNIFR